VTCRIRLYQDGDVEPMHAAAVESVPEMSRWLQWCHPRYSLEEARRWVAEQQRLAEEGLAYAFAVFGESGRFLGGCGINQINNANRFANLGYWVRSSETGRGVAAAAARLVADFAFRKTNLIRLEIVCAVDNVRSQRVAEKLEAVREGTLRSRLLLPNGPSDAIIYSLVRPP